MLGCIGLSGEDKDKIGSKFVHLFFEGAEEGVFEVMYVSRKTVWVLICFEFLVDFELNILQFFVEVFFAFSVFQSEQMEQAKQLCKDLDFIIFFLLLWPKLCWVEWLDYIEVDWLILRNKAHECENGVGFMHLGNRLIILHPFFIYLWFSLVEWYFVIPILKKLIYLLNHKIASN